MTRRIGGQKWLLTLVYEPMSLAEAELFVPFLEEQYGSNGIFYVKIPTLASAAGQVVGNMMNFDNDTKLFRIKATGPVVPHPDERVGGGTVETANVYLKCSLVRDIQQTEYGEDDRVSIEVDLKERL